jgi:hypothetical protein
MASQKNTPNLPASSRMQMPSGGMGTISKERSNMSSSSNGTSKRILNSASGGGLKTKNPYC